MTKCYRVIFQTYDDSNPQKPLNEVCIIESDIRSPTNCLDFSIGMNNQIKLIQGVQDNVLDEKLKTVAEEIINTCPHCE
jgi:hypothetical protein